MEPSVCPYTVFSAFSVPIHSGQCLGVPIHSVQCLGVPIHSVQCLGVPIHSVQCLGVPIHSVQCLGVPIHSVQCPVLATSMKIVPCCAPSFFIRGSSMGPLTLAMDPSWTVAEAMKSSAES